MIRVLILSYVNKFGRIDLDEIRNVVNEPIGLIAQEIVSLYDEGYLTKNEEGYKLTEKGKKEDISVWNVWVDEKEEYFSVEKNRPSKVNEVGIGPMSRFSTS